MKYILAALLLFCTVVQADELDVITFSTDRKEGEEYFFLIATQEGSYIAHSWQFDRSKMWDGKGEPNLSIGSAIDKAYAYFNKSKDELGIAEVEFRPAISKQGSILWYYLVTLTTLPYKFGSEEYEIVVLTSGELLEPNRPKKSS